jgi:hypothetical protein
MITCTDWQKQNGKSKFRHETGVGQHLPQVGRFLISNDGKADGFRHGVEIPGSTNDLVKA